MNYIKKEKTDMAKRERKHELKVYLSDEEERILEAKMKATNMPSKPYLFPVPSPFQIAKPFLTIHLQNEHSHILLKAFISFHQSKL